MSNNNTKVADQGHKKCAIIGTAPSFRQAPWSDTSIKMVALNDSYVLGLPRIDEFYELHPLNKMWFRPKAQIRVNETDVPSGHFVRPEGHVEFLKEAAKTIPVWLQKEPPVDWPQKASRLPIEALEAKYGSYWASGPAYELIHLYERGYREIHIYGIHLSTDHERIEQRHNFEFLIGRLLGPEMKETKVGELRYFEGRECRIVLPKASPILSHGWKYAYEERPKPVQSEMDREWKNVQKEKADLIRQLVNWPDGVSRKKAMDRLSWLEVIEADIQQQQHRQVFSGGTVTIELHPAVMPVRLEPVQVGA
jgi:hypothetical protein